MANHEFGIMKLTPTVNQRFDEYQPQKYDCVSIHDDNIEGLLVEFLKARCYWHTRNRAEHGLAYCGITLIPPESLPIFLAVFKGQNDEAYDTIIALFETAMIQMKYIIHFGI